MGGTSAVEFDDSTGNASVEYVRANGMGGGIGSIVYSLRSEAPSYAFYDARGDVTAKADANGSNTYQAAYEAFGEHPHKTGSDPDPQRANTKDEDPTGLLNEGMRYRDLETGTFITRDPAGFVDGPNMYAYVRQNPWSKFDPMGLGGKTIREKREEQNRFLRKAFGDQVADEDLKNLKEWEEDTNLFLQGADVVIGITPAGAFNELAFGENALGQNLTPMQRILAAGGPIFKSASKLACCQKSGVQLHVKL